MKYLYFSSSLLLIDVKYCMLAAGTLGVWKDRPLGLENGAFI